MIQHFWKCCSAPRDERRLSLAREVPYGDHSESGVDAGLVCAARLEHIVPFRGGSAAIPQGRFAKEVSAFMLAIADKVFKAEL
jgi:hypothetical protein